MSIAAKIGIKMIRATEKRKKKFSKHFEIQCVNVYVLIYYILNENKRKIFLKLIFALLFFIYKYVVLKYLLPLQKFSGIQIKQK